MRDYLQLHLVVLAWGFTAILGKLITLPPLDVTVWRTALAAAGFALLALALRKDLRLPCGEILGLFGTGCIVGWHWVLFFLAARLGTASVCLAALPTTMLWCSLIEPIIDGTRRWRMGELLAGVVMVGAVWLIYHVELRYWQGFTVALLSAVLAAVFAVINKQVTHRYHFSVLSFYQMLGAFTACVVTLPFFEHRALALVPSGADFGWLLVLSMVCTVGGFGGYVDALRRVSVFTANMIYNMEPVYGIVLAALILGDTEKMSGGFYVGAFIIVAAVVLMPLMTRRKA
ncbi:MAG: putative permease [Verrucomicrobiaceae bacterium]|nr:putative permease [Verrucomicrobiaceae bacterium]